MDKKQYEDEKSTEKGIVLPEFKPFFSNNTRFREVPVHHGLFDETSEQITHGKAPWDKYGWSRDGLVL